MKTEHLFLARKPVYHLGKLVALVAGSPPLLCKVDMKMFKHFGIIVVGGTKELDGLDIVMEGMEFGYIYVVTNACIDKVGFVDMEDFQGILHIAKSYIVVCSILSKIDEIQE